MSDETTAAEDFATEGVVTVDERRHILCGDLGALEYAIADYVAKWGEHFTGQPYLGEYGPNLAGIPTGVANMAMTVIRKNLVTSWTEKRTLDAGAIERELQARAATGRCICGPRDDDPSDPDPNCPQHGGDPADWTWPR